MQRFADTRGFTVVEVLVVVGILAILASILLPLLSRSREAGRRASCVNNLKQMAVALKAYAAESPGGKYPPIANYFDHEVECNDPDLPKVGLAARALFFWSPAGMVPDYLSNANVIVCPSDKSWTTDDLVNPVSGQVDVFQKCYGPRGWTMLNGSYVYMGHVYDKLEDRLEFTVDIDIFRDGTHLECRSAPAGSRIGAQLTAGLLTVLGATDEEQESLLDDNFDLTAYAGMSVLPIGNGDSQVLNRLREGVERVLITDTSNPGSSAVAQASIPIMWDQTSTLPSPMGYNHVPGGSNILFLDGHVEFVRYPGVGPTSLASAVFSGCLEG